MMSYADKQFASFRPGDVGVTLSVRKDHRRGIRLTLRIRELTQLNLGWKVGEHFLFTRGTDKDAGKARIERDPRGYRAAKEDRALRINFPAWRELPTISRPSQHCEFEIDDGTLILTLPDWT
jgi:hypothetical protein